MVSDGQLWADTTTASRSHIVPMNTHINCTTQSPSSLRRKQPFIFLNNSVFIESLPSCQSAHARARANHAKNDAQKGCTMQFNGITLMSSSISGSSRVPNGFAAYFNLALPLFLQYGPLKLNALMPSP